MAKQQKFIVTTPLAVASFPHLDKPDTYKPKNQKEDAKPKYKVRLVFDKDVDLEKLDAKMVEAIRAEWGEKIKITAIKSCVKDGDKINDAREEEGKEKNEHIAGKLFIDASSAYQPSVVDTKKKPISPKLVRGGDIVKAVLQLMPCEPSGKKTIGVRLLAVMLVDKRSGEGAGWASEFEEEDGFVGDEGDASAEDEGDEGDTSKGKTGGADDGEDDF